MTWGTFGIQAASLARGLRAAGVTAGDRVLIVSENRPHYPIAETALMAIRAVPVPAYITNTTADHAHVLRDSGATVAIVSTPALAARVLAEGLVETLVLIEPGNIPAPHLLRWADLVADQRPCDDIAAEADLIPDGALACLIYTSGTGGAPRGVMLPHRAIRANCRGAFTLIQQLEPIRQHVYLSFLPLSHSYEHTAGQFFLLSLGAEVVYARGMEHLAADMAAVRPTIMTVVPRVLDVIRGRILTQMAKAPILRQRLFQMALGLGLRRLDGERLGPVARLADCALDRLVRAKLRARFGGRVLALISGGARLEPDVGRFFLAMGLKLLQGYGQTEAGPVIAANPPNAIRIETVGPPLPGVEARIAPDGEILVRGDLVMDGYWARPAETAAVLHDGWLSTGDIGVLEPDGYLRITDRKRDLIALSGGDKVSPARIEGMLAAQPEIAQAVVAGEGQAGLVALLVAQDGADVAPALARVNQGLSVIERIRFHVVVPAFTQDNGLLTATQKVRRHLVLQAHADALASMRRQPGPASRS